MMGYTHALLGAAAGALYAYSTNATNEQAVIMIASATFTALLPDIDHPQAPLRRKLGAVGNVGLFWLKHRGITHTLMALLIVALGAAVVLPHMIVPIVAGYASHLIADMLTKSGIPLLEPIRRDNLHLLPKPLRLTTNGAIERLIGSAVLVLLFVLLDTRYPFIQEILLLIRTWT
jgi:inner membrane protein